MNNSTGNIECPGGSPSLSFDIRRVLCDLNSDFNPLHKDFLLQYQVSGVRDGLVLVTIALPEGMTKVFVDMLQNLAGFFRFIDIKARAASASARATASLVDLTDLKRREDLQKDFRKEVCDLYDGFITQGYDRKQAVKLSNSSLKAKNHPWATHDTISTVLRSSGRFRKKSAVNRGCERSE